MDKYKEKLYAYLRSIPKGKVVTYGQIAKALNIKSARLVGQILHRNPDPDGTPCFRVVFADGRLSEGFGAGGISEHRRRLMADGIRVVEDKVDLSVFRWNTSYTTSPSAANH